MNRVYRVLRRQFARAPFDGEGAYRYGGRWSGPGVRLSYASEHQSLALLEYFVHLDRDDPPADLVLAVAELPEGLSHEQVSPGEAAWRGHGQSGPPLPAIEARPQATSGSDPAKSGEPQQLPRKWRTPVAPPELVRLGNDFARRGQSCLLFVPSALVPNERNCLINPAHPEFRRIRVLPVESLSYDPRMFGKPQRGRGSPLFAGSLPLVA